MSDWSTVSHYIMSPKFIKKYMWLQVAIKTLVWIMFYPLNLEYQLPAAAATRGQIVC